MDENDSRSNYKNLEYLSLSPQYSEDYESSSKLLFNRVRDESVNNIGIIAEYGAGKSSLIKTFKDIYELEKVDNDCLKYISIDKKEVKRAHIKCLDISLANFNIDERGKDQSENVASKSNFSEICKCENQNENAESQSNINEFYKDKNQDKDAINQALEKSILQQMLFNRERNDLPKSQIKRIKSFSWKKFVSISILSATLIIAILSIIFFGINLYGDSVFDFSHERIIFGVVGFILLALFAGGLFQFIEVSKIKFKDLELSMDSSIKESLLNKFLDEVIYYFQKTKYNVVIFEDIDRFDNLNIFVKLRELNKILNSNKKLQQNGKITFVYAIKNTMFGNAEERAKFFDFIVSVFPVLSPINASSKVIEGLEACGFEKNWLPDDFVNDISYYITDMRVLNSTINDCVQLVQNIDLSKINESDSKRKNISVFALMAYKNLYPKEFVEMQERKGELCELIGRVELKRKEYLNKLNKNIDDNKDYLEKLSHQIELNKKDLYLLVKGALFDIKNYGAVSGGVLLQENVDYHDLNTKFQDIDIRGQHYVHASIKEINEHIGGMTLAERYDAFVGNNEYIGNKKTHIIAQNKKLQHEIDNCERNDFEFIKKYPNQVFNSEDSSFIKMLLTNGYLDENYRDYLSKSGDSFMAENDKIFIKSVIQNDSTPLTYIQLVSSSVICEKLSIDKFNRLAILNIDFINYMFSSDCKYSQKREILCKLLKSDNDEVVKFIGHYFSKEKSYQIDLVKCLLARNDFISIIKRSNIDDDSIDRLFIFIIKNLQLDLIEEQEDLPFIIEKLIGNFTFVKDIIKNDNNILMFLKNNSFKIKNLDNYSYSKIDIMTIDKYCIWELNVKNMIYILSSLYDYKKEAVLLKGFSMINSLGRTTKEYILKDISYYIHNIMLKTDTLELAADDFVGLVNNENISIEDKTEIIKKQNSRMNYFDCDLNILKLLLDNDKVLISLDQIATKIKDWEELKDSLVAFILRHKKDYEGQKITSEILAYTIANYVDDRDISALEELVDLIDIAQLKIAKIKNDKSLAFLINVINEISSADVVYISSNELPESQKFLACIFINDLLQKELINSKLAQAYVRYGNNLDSRLEIYKLETVDCINDFSDAQRVIRDIFTKPVKISDKLFDRLLLMNRDKKELIFINQLKFMDRHKILKRLPQVDSSYYDLIKNGKIDIDHNDPVLEELYRMKLLRKRKKGYSIIELSGTI